MRNWIKRNEKLTLRLLEMLPGFFSWNMILLPYWGIFVFPNFVAYFVLLFNVYWFYQSLLIAVTSIVSHLKIQAALNYDWLSDLKTFKDWNKLNHVVIIPTYKEPLHILERTMQSLISQTLPTKMITVIIAMEEKEPLKDRDTKFQTLNSKFGNKFNNFIQTVHKLVPGEVVGKASNERFAATYYYKNYIKDNRENLDYTTITSCDADHTFNKNYFSALSFKFLDNPKRYKYFWQPAILFYNNIWQVPSPIRVLNTLMSIWNLSQLPRKDRLIIGPGHYSLSFKLLHKSGYWDADKIPEDWGIFFKSFYKAGGGVEVEPIYLPLFADAVQSHSTWQTFKNQYLQIQRWAWGASDDSWIIRNYLIDRKIPFWDKTTRVVQALKAHFLWPVNWFIITIGLTIPTLINPAFGRTALGFMVPKLSSIILTISLAFLLVMIFIDNVYKPKDAPYWKRVFSPLEFVLMPVVGFIFGAIPGLDAHTRLMLGKYIQYKVTEKV